MAKLFSRFFSKFSSPATTVPLATIAVPQTDVHVMPDKFIPHEKQTNWFTRRMAIGIMIIVVVGGGMGVAAWLVIRSLKPTIPETVDSSAPTTGQSDQSAQQPEQIFFSPPAATSSPLAEDPQGSAPPSSPSSTTPVYTPPTNPEPVATPPAFPSPLPRSSDTDGDGLTDLEEGIWGTDPVKLDTDSDGYSDGGEIHSLFDPLVGGGALLEQSSRVRTYYNTLRGYTILVPASWEQRLLDPSTGAQVLFVASTGEFVSVISEQNLEGFSSARDWYASQYAGIEPSALQEALASEMVGVMSQDEYAGYFLAQGYINTISYNPGIRDAMNFQVTFLMMMRSFKIVVSP